MLSIGDSKVIIGIVLVDAGGGIGCADGQDGGCATTSLILSNLFQIFHFSKISLRSSWCVAFAKSSKEHVIKVLGGPKLLS